ncbi:MAG TPA: polyphosphate kinase 1 [Ignavibacteria bacterium]
MIKKGSEINLKDPSLYINREISWLEFNRRVLEEALDKTTPLLERLKFLCIFNSNLDEFFMIRVAGIYDQIAARVFEVSPDGKLPEEQLVEIHKLSRCLVEEQMRCFREEILPELQREKIHILTYKDLSEEMVEDLRKYYYKEIFPVLTPLAFDPGHPFPYISNLSLNLAVIIKSPEEEEHFARVKIPNVLPRLIRMDSINEKCKIEFQKEGIIKYIFLDEIISNNLNSLFPEMEIIESYLFRVTRDTDVEIQEDEASDLLQTIEEGLRQLRFGSIIRLEVESRMSKKVKDTLLENMELSEDEVYEINGPLGLQDLMIIYNLPFHHLKDSSFHPQIPQVFEENDDIFSIIRKKDVLLHHPYDSFNPVVDFIRKAAHDPNVLTIKQTLYRVGKNSPIVQALIEAAENGKQVAVLVELKARFDEENNIIWAKALERVGVHVVYGLMGLKTHAKATLIVRKENDGLRRYVHLGTGNYNAITTKIYTDFGLFTCREDIGADVSDLFNFLTGYSRQKKYRKLVVAPTNMRKFLLEKIEREIEVHRKYGNGLLIFKMNALVDPEMIQALYRASQAGVIIKLIVRGICCLRPGITGVSDNITVISIVGRFLEHSRIYYFRNVGDEEVYLGSADLMQRNLDRRVELLFPIEDTSIKDHIIHNILELYLKDNVKARIMNKDGKYSYVKPEEKSKRINSQIALLPRKFQKAAKTIK